MGKPITEAIRKWMADNGRKGGEAGTGEVKRRETTFTSKLARAAARKRWGKKRQKSHGK